jgi:hypothetical protein
LIELYIVERGDVGIDWGCPTHRHVAAAAQTSVEVVSRVWKRAAGQI